MRRVIVNEFMSLDGVGAGPCTLYSRADVNTFGELGFENERHRRP